MANVGNQFVTATANGVYGEASIFVRGPEGAEIDQDALEKTLTDALTQALHSVAVPEADVAPADDSE